MTESEWLNAGEPHAMLAFVQSNGSPSERKLRLFAVACSRRLWSRIDRPGQTAVETAERFSDGLAGAEELRAARLACQGAGGDASWYAAASNAGIAARNAARSAQAGAEANELLAQADLMRDIFGNPFQPQTVDPSWRTFGVAQLAQTIYDSRLFERMPELGAELAKAGCTELDVLSHCRTPNAHVRGCWVVDVASGLLLPGTERNS